MTASCPACDAPLRVPAGFRRGRCPKCGALLGQQRNPVFRRPQARRAAEAYRSFHGAGPRRMREHPDVPSNWWALGWATTVEYEPYGKSERQGAVWRHSFGDTGHGRKQSTARLYASEDGKALLILGNFQVSRLRGIVG